MFRIMSGLTTKKERDLAMQRELLHLQSRISRPNLSSNQMRELLTRGIYCETLGYPAACLYIHAIKLAQQGSLIDKRMGYLAATIFLHKDHELTLLLINTILKDLNSKSVCEVNMALTAAAYLANKEMASVLIGTVEKMMHSHPKALVRKKAILFYKHLLTINPSYVMNIDNTDHLKRCIEDGDPEVVSTVIHALSDLVQMDARVYRDLLEPCLAILKQIIRRKFPSDYDYHNLPAPWLQIEILKLLPLLNDVNRASMVQEILEEVMKNIDVNHTMSNAIFYQCVCAIVGVCPHDHLLESSSKLISEFLHSTKIDMQYMGLKALTLLVKKGHPKYAAHHQDFIIDSLRHRDMSIRSKTFNLLLSLVNSANIKIVWPKLVKHVDTTDDKCIKEDLAIRCAKLLLTHSHADATWTFEKVLTLVSISPSQIHPQLLLILKQLLSQENTDSSLINIGVNKCSEILKENQQPSNELVEFCAWVMGTYADCYSFIVQLAQLLPRYSQHHQVLSSLLIAIKKLLLKSKVEHPVDGNVERLIGDCSKSDDCLVRHRSRELNYIVQNRADKSFNDSANGTYDWTLSFLDPTVEQCLASATCMPYKPKSLRKIQIIKDDESKINSSINTHTVATTKTSLASSRGSSRKNSSLGTNIDYLENVWSKDGYRVDKKSQNQNHECDQVAEKPLEKEAEDTELAMALFN